MKPANTPTDELPVDAIRIGKRYRQHMGDIEGLAASIAEHGLMHPIVVTPERELVAGERRLQAVRSLGWATVPVRVVTPANLLRAETDENAVRADFLPSEAVALAKALEPTVKAEAKERQRAGGGKPGSGKLPEPKPETRDRLAGAVGMSGKTLAKAMAVVAAADADPELGPVVEEMDRTGSIDAAFRKLPRPPTGADVLPMNDVHRKKWPDLAYADMRSDLVHDMYAFGKPGKFRSEDWVDRIGQLRPEDLALVRQNLDVFRRWLDKWDRLLERPALSLVEGSPE